MMPQWFTDNLLAWTEQVFLLASAGSLLLIALRIRHARTKLAYCHALLAVCLLLPLLQPWKHPLIARDTVAEAGIDPAIDAPEPAVFTPTGAAAAASIPSSSMPPPTAARWPRIPEGRLILWLLAAGAAVKICWLLGGLWRIRKYRIASMPLYPIPEPVRAASAVTQTDALFCISSDVPGPVMLGWLTPVVLLPESFLTLGEEAQCGVACHELLHVRRHDWLITLLQELAGTLLWFNPAIWLLLAQTRLAREQLVDAEVVRLTAAREPYIDALLAIARGGHHLDLAPAPLFLRRRHLTQRVHSLLKDASTSTLKLLSSYAFITAMLALVGWFGFTSFPLIGQPAFRETPREAGPVEIAASQQSNSAPAIPQSENRRPAGTVMLPLTPPDYIPSAPVPQDLHEPVLSGPIRALTSPSDRAAALALLQRARDSARLRMPNTPPYRFDVSFTAGGNVMHTGPGHLSWIRFSGQRERWSADLDGFSVVQIRSAGATLEVPHVTMIPMRVQNLRSAIFWAAREYASGDQIRSAAVQWNGRPATCLLFSNVSGQAALTQARLWEEDEYCIDNATSLLQMYSIAPGTYAVYGYSKNIQFHGESLADHITIYTGGAIAADAEFTIAEAGPADESLFTPTPEMHADNAMVVFGSTTRFQMKTLNPYPAKLVQSVIVHAEIDGSGKVLEEELSAASDPALVQMAFELVKQSPFRPVGSTQWQAFFNVRFMPQSGSNQ
jgi:beta-lactamase regulating signal transducer with metallopeptidase domain